MTRTFTDRAEVAVGIIRAAVRKPIADILGTQAAILAKPSNGGDVARVA